MGFTQQGQRCKLAVSSASVLSGGGVQMRLIQARIKHPNRTLKASEMGEENGLASRFLALFSLPVAGCAPLANQTRVTPHFMERPQRESKSPPPPFSSRMLFAAFGNFCECASFPPSESTRVVLTKHCLHFKATFYSMYTYRKYFFF